jgi:ATP-dependent helicase/nuclease subunit B
VESVFHYISSPSAAVRLDAACTHVDPFVGDGGILIVGASRAAADELAFRLAERRGGLFDVRRAGFTETALRLARLTLAEAGASPSGALGVEAMTTRVAFDAHRTGALEYFDPVAAMPGFPRAASRTLNELQMAAVSSDALRALGPAGADLARLLDGVDREAERTGTVPRAAALAAAARALRAQPDALGATTLVLLDLAIASTVDEAFVAALVDAATTVIAVSPAGDDRAAAMYRRIAGSGTVARLKPGPTPGPTADPPPALTRLQSFLFSVDPPPVADSDSTVRVFSAPGEGREAVEIARRILDEASRGVRFDQMAVLLRAPHTYFGLIEHAFSRAGVPVWFERGTRRPDAAGRAFLALLACADENLSARRFAEYLSLGQVPISDGDDRAEWSPSIDEVIESLIPSADRPEDGVPLDEAPGPEERDGDRIVAGTLQAPWRWEELLVEAYVIQGLDRWRRRLPGLREEYEVRLRELAEEDPDSPRIAALRRDCDQLKHLEEVALPIVETLNGWRDTVLWSAWLDRLKALAPRVLRQPTRVLRVLGELTPLGNVGPVTLKEVRDVLIGRLRTLTHEPPRRRQGRVFVGTSQAARGRQFRVVFVPGLAERVFPQRLREDALLLDARRRQLGHDLATLQTRADEERLQLRLAVGAASERVYLSYPRVELRESRARVPSFYVLDIERATTGRLPNYSEIADRANREGAASLSWPAPPSPDKAIDDFEHDLAVLRPLLRHRDLAAVGGRARYLIDLNPSLRRSLTERWARFEPRWSKADGLVAPTAEAAAALARHRLAARSYSLTALQRYASCPYQFLLAAIYRLAPLEDPAPLQRLDPLTRGSLFHEIQTKFYRTLQQNGQLPVTEARLSSAKQQLEWAIQQVAGEAANKFAPAIDKVWKDEIALLRQDLLLWVEKLPNDPDWEPQHFEFAFGLPDEPERNRDPASTPSPAVVAGRFQLRGSIDLIERNPRTGALRVTDHKTGRNRTTRATVVQGGRVLQPVLYGIALESIMQATVYEGRLWYCTTAGNFEEHAIPLGETARRSGIEVLEIIDRAVERGPLAARPARDACRWCDFRPICGNEEEWRTARKPSTLEDLDALRRLP